jgi:hypothetical protein
MYGDTVGVKLQILETLPPACKATALYALSHAHKKSRMGFFAFLSGKRRRKPPLARS